MEFHPVANIFPLIEGDEFAALKADIDANGVHDPVWTWEGKIIDGRNRWRACQELGIECPTREWDGKGSLVAFVLSLNLHRRHLTSSQRAVVSLAVEKLLAEEAKERQREAGRKSGGDHRSEAARQKKPDQVQQLFAEPDPADDESPEPEPDQPNPQARDDAAKLTGTNRQYVSDAKKIERQAPDLIDKVRSGEMTIPQAMKQLPKNPTTRAAPAWCIDDNLAAAGFRPIRLRKSRDGPRLWERGGRIYSAEAALELVEGEQLYRDLFGGSARGEEVTDVDAMPGDADAEQRPPS